MPPYLANHKKVELPAAIPCSQCKIPKPPSQFSPKRLEDLQKAILTENKQTGKTKRDFDPKVDRVICCTKCLGGPAVEKECFHCEITFPKTDRYFSKSMLRNRKDEALCWSCSEREQNDTLSSDGEGSGSDSDASDETFITNRFQDVDLESTTDTSSTSGLYDDSSGGVSLRGSYAPGAGHTVYAGSAASMASSARGSLTSPSVGRTSSTMGSSAASISSSVASTRAPASTKQPSGFDPDLYGNPGRRSPTDSMASGTNSKDSCSWAKVRAVPTTIFSDAAREQRNDMKRRAAAASQSQDMQVSDSKSSEGDVSKPVSSNKAAGKLAPSKGPSFEHAQNTGETLPKDANKAQVGWRQGPPSKLPMRSQTKTDNSCAINSQQEQLDEVSARSDLDIKDGSDDDYHDSDNDSLP